MRIRLRGPGGSSTLTLEEDATVGDLKAQISQKTSLDKFDIKYGYPPKPLHMDRDSVKLSELDVPLNGEQLTISAHDSPVIRGAENDTGNERASTTISNTPSTRERKSEGVDATSFAGMASGQKSVSSEHRNPRKSSGPVSLKRKEKDMDVPELPLPDRGATLGL
jgi:ubiquitin thioesterase OTU1